MPPMPASSAFTSSPRPTVSSPGSDLGSAGSGSGSSGTGAVSSGSAGSGSGSSGLGLAGSGSGAPGSGSAELASAAEILAFALHENFPVALKVLRQPWRADLLALYGFARLVDNLGDSYGGDRLAALQLAEQELELAYAGQASHEIFRNLQPAISRCGLDKLEFVKLIEANRLDQTKTRQASWSELMEYCELSANPVGRLVLQIFGQSTPANVAWSDSICSALQVIEHLQDVGEDYRAGRVYLPADELAQHGCLPEVLAADVGQAQTSPELAQVVLALAGRSREMLRAGEPLVRALKGQPRLAIAGFIAGGQAAVDAIEAAQGDVLSALRQPRKTRFARHFARLCWRGFRGRQPAVAASR